MKHHPRRDHPAEDSNAPRQPLERLGQAVGHTRFVVLIAVAAVMLVAASLFALGTVQAFKTVYRTWSETLHGAEPEHLSIDFLEIVIVMLEAVVFFLIGVGLYSLFIAPLNLAIALGVETLNDLEERVISVVVAVLALTFLEHFIAWKDPLGTLQFGAALALTVAALVFFLRHSQRDKEQQKRHEAHAQRRSKRDMFHHDEEHHEIKADDESDRATRDAGTNDVRENE